jgi:hypothetical protein
MKPRTWLAAGLIAVAPLAWSQTTITMQQLVAYVTQVANVLIAEDAKIKALETQVAVLTSDMGIVVGAHDRLLRAMVIQVCASNAHVDTWAATLVGLQKIPLGTIECPPAGAKWYIPYYIGPGGPPIPPAE